MNRAVFLDRDGVINSDDGLYYLVDPADFKINPGVPELLKWLKKHGFLLIVISNQGGISKGIYSKKDVEFIHAKMNEQLDEQGIFLDEIYYCPHHPENERCICRKPDTIMIEKAISRFSIDVNESYFIGDRETDMEAGKKTGLKTVKVESNQDMSLLIEFFKKELKFS
jgi:D-glycero-D-manno-heptose 1,7-bisphosphate phosphatase